MTGYNFYGKIKTTKPGGNDGLIWKVVFIMPDLESELH